jgi:hypothetical protein
VVAGRPAVRREAGAWRQYLVAHGSLAYRFSAAAGGDDQETLDYLVAHVRIGDPAPPADDAPFDQSLDGPVTSAGEAQRVRAVYLVPSDRLIETGYRQGLERAMRQVQAYYRSQLGGKTFQLHDPMVEVMGTSHPVSWYQSMAPAADPAYRFWNGTISDGFALTGGGFDDPQNRWLFLIDADSLCGQIGGAGTSGVAVVPKNDARNLLCESLVSACPGDTQYPGICVSTGGIGHELGHAFDLPHPDLSTCPAADPDCSHALMWLGYLTYPTAYLLDADKTSLLTNPLTAAFFTTFDPGPVPYACTEGCPPTRPANLAVSTVGPSLHLLWDPVAGADSYTVYRRPGSDGLFNLAASGVASAAYVDAALPGGQSYSYLVTATGPRGESGNSNVATGTLPPNMLSVADVTVAEGDSETRQVSVTVNLSPPSGVTVTANYATVAGSATAGVDYDDVSGQIAIPAGATSGTIVVPIHGDRLDEGDETLQVRLSSPGRASLGRAAGVVTIQDDDISGVSIDDLTVSEVPGTSTATFTVSLLPENSRTITVAYATRDGSAVAGEDYEPTSGTLTFSPGTTSLPVTVNIRGDSVPEDDESFFLDLGPPSRGLPLVPPGFGTVHIIERGFFTLEPCRLVDTRDPAGPFGGPALAAEGARTFTLGGRCGIPTTARAVVLNVTVTNAQREGHLRLYAGDASSIPLVSSLNYVPDVTRANNAVVGLGPGGTLTIGCYQAEGSVDVIVDVAGFVR